MLYKFYNFLIFVTCLCFFVHDSGIAQTSNVHVDNFRLPSTLFSWGGYDTVGYKISQDISKETVGIVEKEVDPNRYIVGPGDVLTISIVLPQSITYDAPISPDGKLHLKEVGAVTTKDKTLAQLEKEIRLRVLEVYKAREVAISLKKVRTFKVSIAGAIRRPQVVMASSVDRVSEVIERAGGLLKDASTRNISIIRSGKIIPVDLLSFFLIGEDDCNEYLTGGDRINVPFVFESDYIKVSGAVRNQGNYEYKEGDSLSRILRFAQGLTADAIVDSVEIARFDERGESIFIFDARIDSGLSSSITLKRGDRVYVRRKPNYLETREIAVHGGVKLPGRYAINRNNARLKEVIEKAGGLTLDAVPSAARLIRRKEIVWYDREFERLSKLDPEQMTDREKNFFQIRSNETLGLVSVDFSKMLNGDTSVSNNPILLDQDSIYIPENKYFVNVIGRVNKPGRVNFKPGLNFIDYINLAGGFGFKADPKETFIQRSTGEQFKADELETGVSPGDTILIPEEKDSNFVETFTKILAVIAQLATVASIYLAVKNSGN